jgi:HAD superfamily hydrolase (TIGR01459 family)
MQTPPASAVPLLTSVAALASTADAWICDIWGVLHNGIDPFPQAAAAAIAFRASGGIVCLLSNSPRPRAAVIAQMAEIGVAAGAYDLVLTSGDLTRRLIEQRADKRMFHLGPPKDLPIFDGLGVTFVDEHEAKFVICSGYYDDDIETPDDYKDMLATLRSNNATMVCANPDLFVERGERIVYCAGAMAQAYEAIGGQVVYAGKPHLPAYELAHQMIEAHADRSIGKDRILAIGDGLRTDIAGATNFGARALFIASALHTKGPLDQATLSDLFGQMRSPPIAAMDALIW